MNRNELIRSLRDARSDTEAGRRRRLHQLRAGVAAPWLDATLRAELRWLADACGVDLELPPPAPLEPGETWLLVVDEAQRGDVLRARVRSAKEVHDPLASADVDAAIRGLAAAASGMGQSLPSAAFDMAIEVPGVPSLRIAGGSLGLAACAAIVSVFTGKPASSSVAASARIDENGRLRPIEHLQAKCHALRARWPDVHTVVVAVDQPEESIDGLAIVRAPDLEQAIPLFGMDLLALPPLGIEDLVTRLTVLEREERQHQASRRWLSLSAEAWSIGERLRAEGSPRWVEAQIGAGLMASHAGDQELAAALLEAIAPDEIPRAMLRAHRLVALASCNIDRNPFRAREAAAEALSILDGMKDDDPREMLGKATGTYGRVLMHLGDFATAEPLLRKAYEHHGGDRGGAEAHRSACYLACCLRLQGKAEQALTVATSALHGAEAAQLRTATAKSTISYASLERGRALQSLGRVDEAAFALENVVAVHASVASYPRLGGHRSLASVHRAAGRLDQAREHLDVCRHVARSADPLTLRRVGAVAAAEELRAAECEVRPTLLPRHDLEDAWKACFGDADVDHVLRTWVY